MTVKRVFVGIPAREGRITAAMALSLMGDMRTIISGKPE
jgi:hypothetical protein